MIQGVFNESAWGGTALALTGAVLIAHNQRRFGYTVFLIADGLMLPVQVYTHTWAQVALLLTYAGINVYGLLKKIN